MKKTTKVAALVLAMAMAVSTLTACGGEKDAAADAANTEAAGTETETSEENAAEEADAADDTEAAEPDGAADTEADAAEGEEADTEQAGAVTTRTEGVLTFGTNAEFQPFEFVTGTGVIDQYDGIDMAIAKQIAEDNGMTVAM